jgi:FkbM family methyltransferase
LAGGHVIDTPLAGTPIWVSAAAAVIRRLPAGRIRAMNWVGGQQLDPFWTKLPTDLGSLSFQCDLRDGLMREVCFTGRYEPQETAVLRHLLHPGMTFVDVGANWGYFTLIGAHLVGSTGRVLSVEADPRAARTLRANVGRNALQSVQVYDIAASDGPGLLTFQEYEPEARDSGNFGVAQSMGVVSGRRYFKVASRALDDVLDEAGVTRVHVMKMDIEGGEARAIAGLRRRLSANLIDCISMEVHPDHLRDLGSSAPQVIAELRGHGYRPWRIDHSRAAFRAAAATGASVPAMLTPLDGDGRDLGDWPHLLWTLERTT